MTAQLNSNSNEIIFGKWWAKKQGYVATAAVEKNGKYLKAVNYVFLPSEPIDKEEAQKNYHQKHCAHVCKIPQDYSGLIVSESSIYGQRKCEKWFWLAEKGKIIKNTESLNELFGK